MPVRRGPIDELAAFDGQFHFAARIDGDDPLGMFQERADDIRRGLVPALHAADQAQGAFGGAFHPLADLAVGHLRRGNFRQHLPAVVGLDFQHGGKIFELVGIAIILLVAEGGKFLAGLGEREQRIFHREPGQLGVGERDAGADQRAQQIRLWHRVR